MNSSAIWMYLFKTILVSSVLYGYYVIALRDKKFHYYNRFYLLAALTLSVVIPLLNFSWFTVEKPVLYGSSEVLDFIFVADKVPQVVHFDWTDGLLMLMLLVGFVLLIMLFVYIFQIYQLKNKAEIVHMDGFDFINTDEDKAPFSFLDNMFWKKAISLSDIGGQQIFKHEITHIQQRHTWDRLYCQIVSSILWMNPFSWLIQKELQTIHEFIADEEAVGNSDVEAFAQMLLQTHYGNHFLNPVHSFFYSSIKRRLIMLTTSKKTKYSYLRRVMILPLLIVLVGIFSIKVNATERISNKVIEIKNAIQNQIADTSKPSNTQIAKKITGINLDTTSVSIDSLANNAVVVMGKDKSTIVIGGGTKNADGTFSNQAMKDAMIIIDGKRMDWNRVNEIDVKSIAMVEVMKDAASILKYGEAGKKGVIIITTKKGSTQNNSLPENDIKVVTGTSVSIQNGLKVIGEPLNSITLKGNANKEGAQPLYVIDGVPVKEGSANPIKYMSPNMIESINILKDKSATAIYGKAAVNGVVLVTTKIGNKKAADPLENISAEAITVTGKPSTGADRTQNDFSEVTVIGYKDKASAKDENIRVFTKVDKPAQFPGGNAGWLKYLERNLNRDLPVMRGGPVGKYTVRLSFVVNEDGSVSKVRSLNDPGYGTAEEAIRVIEKGPYWVPAEQNGNKVKYLVKQTVTFAIAAE
jgi:TonB-dependent SusC/RagA subfamily outer membrane receptor